MKNIKTKVMFMPSYFFSWKPKVYFNRKLKWKDKYKTPRVEELPKLRIDWLGFTFEYVNGTEEYWERYLWVHKYNDGDESLAEETWPWRNENKKSTWLKY
jgi:hypothetical protein